MRVVRLSTYRSPPAREAGAVLVVSLVLLVVLTMLGLTTMNMTSLEEKMAGNSQDFSRAFQSAESGLVDALQPENAGNLPDDIGEATDPVTLLGGTASYLVQNIDCRTPVGEVDADQPITHDASSASKSSGAGGGGGAGTWFFNVQSTGATNQNRTTVTLHGGMYKLIGPCPAG